MKFPPSHLRNSSWKVPSARNSISDITLGSSGWKGLYQMPTSVGSASDGIAEPQKMTAAERKGIFLRILRWRFSSDTLTFHGLGEIADAVLHAVYERIDRLRLPISIQCVWLV